MSIVEKAAERLRRQRSSNGDRPAIEPATPKVESREERPSTVEKAVEKSRNAHSGTFVNGKAATTTLDGAPMARGGKMTLDRARLCRAGLLPTEGLKTRIGREFQRIKRPLLAGILGEDGRPSPRANRIMVTSADPGDGKTFTSFNLAMSLANELDYSVLLVDGDVAKPGISRSLGLRDHIGLMDVLNDPSIGIEEAMVASDLPNLLIMPAGGRREQPAERLSSRRMDDMMAELASDPTRIVVFDSPPLLATAESQALALNMGQIVMVVRAGRTERRALESALSLIDPETATISLILNQSRKGFGDNYDGYYGVYGAETD